ncbi:MAG: hypothetical protein AAF447_13055 [Myxococcota bacterium]
MQRMRWVYGLVFVLGGAAVAGCGDDDGTGTTGTLPMDMGTTSFRADVFPIIAANCAISGCHGSTRTSANLLMDTPDTAHASLVDVEAMGGPCTEDSVARIRVVPGDPEASLLVSKVTETPPDCGNPMPLAQPALSAADQATITAWVAAGAVND